jgi:cytochrome c6
MAYMVSNMKKITWCTVALITVGITGFFGVKLFNYNQFGKPDLTNGKSKFITNCAVCHGLKGRGDGIAANTLTISPDDIYDELTNPLGFKSELISSVLNGDNGQGGVMPAFKNTLSESDVNDIFMYIKVIN